jgi:hypothetical protein
LREDAGEEIATFAQLTVGGVGECPEVGRLLSVLGVELDDPVGCGKRPRVEGERVDGAEHRGVQADAKREDENGRGGEAGILEQLPEGRLEVVHGQWSVVSGLLSISLLRSQCDHRIDFGGTAGRKRTPMKLIMTIRAPRRQGDGIGGATS